jgi:hypothetical protein
MGLTPNPEVICLDIAQDVDIHVYIRFTTTRSKAIPITARADLQGVTCWEPHRLDNWPTGYNEVARLTHQLHSKPQKYFLFVSVTNFTASVV